MAKLILFSLLLGCQNRKQPTIQQHEESTPGPMSETPPVRPAAESTPAGREIEVAAPSDEIISAYKANEIAADQRFKNHRVRIVGVAQEINTNIVGDGLVSPGESRWSSVKCKFPKARLAELVDMKKGAWVVLDCTGAGMLLGTVYMHDCEWQPFDTVVRENPDVWRKIRSRVER